MRSQPHGSEPSSFETVKREGQSSAVAGQKTWRNPAWTKTKIKFLGNACEKAKHHLNPSSDKPKNDAFAARPHGSETSASKPLKEKDKAAQSLDKKRKRIGNACEKAKRHLNPSSEQPKNDAFATTRVRTVLFETVKKEAGSRAVAGQKTWRNPAWTKTKIKLIGNACEKAKHHLNPSSDKPKKNMRSPPFHTGPKRPLRNR